MLQNHQLSTIVDVEQDNVLLTLTVVQSDKEASCYEKYVHSKICLRTHDILPKIKEYLLFNDNVS